MTRTIDANRATFRIIQIGVNGCQTPLSGELGREVDREDMELERGFVWFDEAVKLRSLVSIFSHRRATGYPIKAVLESEEDKVSIVIYAVNQATLAPAPAKLRLPAPNGLSPNPMFRPYQAVQFT